MKLIMVVLCLSSMTSTSIAADTCADKTCGFGQTCVETRLDGAVCQCDSRCYYSSRTGPLCTKDGHTYESLCALRKEECRQGRAITVSRYGRCSSSIKVPCFDQQRQAKFGLCKMWKGYGSCKKQFELMQSYCRRTCGFCKDEGPEPACYKSSYGCCSSSEAPALGPNDEGCDVQGCVDGALCKVYTQFCGDPHNLDTMKKYCPRACGYCSPNTS